MDKHSYNEHICNNMRYRREHGVCGHNDAGHGMCGHNDTGHGMCSHNETGYGVCGNNYACNDMHCSKYDWHGNTMPPVYDDKYYYDRCDLKCKNEHGDVFVTNVGKSAIKNTKFKKSYWTGKYLQMTLVSLDCGEDIGVECHDDADEYIRVERGNGVITTGNSRDCMWNKKRLCEGDSVFIPAGTWHNITNCGRGTLKISSIYAPPHHPKCTVEKHK